MSDQEVESSQLASVSPETKEEEEKKKKKKRIPSTFVTVLMASTYGSKSPLLHSRLAATLTSNVLEGTLLLHVAPDLSFVPTNRAEVSI